MHIQEGKQNITKDRSKRSWGRKLCHTRVSSVELSLAPNIDRRLARSPAKTSVQVRCNRELDGLFFNGLLKNALNPFDRQSCFVDSCASALSATTVGLTMLPCGLLEVQDHLVRTRYQGPNLAFVLQLANLTCCLYAVTNRHICVVLRQDAQMTHITVPYGDQRVQH